MKKKNKCRIVTMTTMRKNKLASICFEKFNELITYIERVKFKVRLNGIYTYIYHFSMKDVNKGGRKNRNTMRYVRSKDKHTNIKYRYPTFTIIITNLDSIMIGIIIWINLEN
jgi:hypothetical protein